MLTGREVVVQLLIDDGVPERLSRNKILNGDLNVMGCFSETQDSNNSITYVDYGIE